MLKPSIKVDLGQIVIASDVTRSQLELTAPEMQWLLSPDGLAQLRAALARIDPESELVYRDTCDTCERASERLRIVASRFANDDEPAPETDRAPKGPVS
jgi:hypothetical protein